jgi:hypothetical protein
VWLCCVLGFGVGGEVVQKMHLLDLVWGFGCEFVDLLLQLFSSVFGSFIIKNCLKV